MEIERINSVAAILTCLAEIYCLPSITAASMALIATLLAFLNIPPEH